MSCLQCSGRIKHQQKKTSVSFLHHHRLHLRIIHQRSCTKLHIQQCKNKYTDTTTQIYSFPLYSFTKIKGEKKRDKRANGEKASTCSLQSTGKHENDGTLFIETESAQHSRYTYQMHREMVPSLRPVVKIVRKQRQCC